MGTTILVVDDSALARARIGSALAGMAEPPAVLAAASGVEALTILAEREVDLVITDLDMPGLDGAALISHMQKRQEWAVLPLLVVSSEHSERRGERVAGLPVAAHMGKPFTAARLRAIVEGILDGRV